MNRPSAFTRYTLKQSSSVSMVPCVQAGNFLHKNESRSLMASEEAPVVQSTASSLWSSVASSLGGAFGTQAKDLLYAGIKQKYNEHSSALKEQVSLCMIYHVVEL